MAIFTIVPSAQACAAASERVAVPAGTVVDVSLADPREGGEGLTTFTFPPGTTFRCKADEAVVVSGRVVVQKDAEGQGTIVESAGPTSDLMQSAGTGNHGYPKLTIRFDWITAVDGLKIRLGDLTTTGGDAGQPAQSVAAPTYTQQQKTIARFFKSGTSGGRNIDDAQVFNVRVASTVHTVSSIMPSQDGFAH